METIEAMRPMTDEIRIDALGNAIALKRGAGKRKVMIAAHVDEIGFIVRHIDSNGFLKLHPIGGFDPRALFAQRVIVTSASGQELRGALMPGSRPIHLMTGEEPKASKVDDYFVDLGLSGDAAREAVENTHSPFLASGTC